MPYIKSAERLALATSRKRPMNPGELNYLITRQLIDIDEKVITKEEASEEIKKLILEYCENHSFKYQTANDVGGAVFFAGMEYNRRHEYPIDSDNSITRLLKRVINSFYIEHMGPYEDVKKVENGDVYKSLGEI